MSLTEMRLYHTQHRLRALRELTPGRSAFFLGLFCLLLFIPGLFSLPPLDRDEARFSQASVQMLESGNYFDIRFQDTPRYKKPPGAYWLQVASLKLFGSPEQRRIWVHRLPSVLAVLAAVLALFFFSAPFLGYRPAAFASAALAASLIVVAEAHQAKTDAILLFCALLAQLPLCRLWMLSHEEGSSREMKPDSSTNMLAALFWLAQACAILVKGPVLALITVLTIITLGLSLRRWAWLKLLRPVYGVAAILVFLAPFLWMIEHATGGAFTRDAVSGDMLPKLLSGQESHGAPPGYYTLLSFVTFWPASLFLLPVGVQAWIHRREALPMFLLAWLIPAWLVFEFVPTKLPHYVLPLYPALALLVAWALFPPADKVRAVLSAKLSRCSAVIWLILSLILIGGAFMLPWIFGDKPLFAIWILAPIALFASVFAFVQAWRHHHRRAFLISLLAAVPFYVMTLECVLPHLSSLDLSSRAVALLHENNVEANSVPVGAVGYHEPSLVYLAGTQTKLVKADQAATLISERQISGVLVSAKETPAFLHALGERGEVAWIAGNVSGFNYSKGEKVTLHLFLSGTGPVFAW